MSESPRKYDTPRLRIWSVGRESNIFTKKCAKWCAILAKGGKLPLLKTLPWDKNDNFVPKQYSNFK